MPVLVTVVGIIGIIAGVVPALEVVGVLSSPRFASMFVPLVRAIVPVAAALLLWLLSAISVVDITLGIGVLFRQRWAMIGMIIRSFLGLSIDYLNSRAHNPAGAIFGFAVNILLILILLLPKSRAWFRGR
jgi:hypothetical protein